MTLVLQQTKEADFLQEIESGLNAHNTKVFGKERIAVNFSLKDGKIVKGGMKASCVGTHFFISWLYVDASVRKQGWGKKLMEAAELDALKRNCQKIFVDTMSFQAPDFYEALGFKMCARITDFYEGHDRIFFQKKL